MKEKSIPVIGKIARKKIIILMKCPLISLSSDYIRPHFFPFNFQLCTSRMLYIHRLNVPIEEGKIKEDRATSNFSIKSIDKIIIIIADSTHSSEWISIEL